MENTRIIGEGLKVTRVGLGCMAYIVPIPGSRKEERLKENLGSIDVVLTAEEIEGIDTLLGK